MPSTDGTRVHDAFVMKPVDVQTLLDRMGELLAIEWLHEPQRAEDEPLMPEPGSPDPGPTLGERLDELESSGPRTLPTLPSLDDEA